MAKRPSTKRREDNWARPDHIPESLDWVENPSQSSGSQPDEKPDMTVTLLEQIKGLTEAVAQQQQMLGQFVSNPPQPQVILQTPQYGQIEEEKLPDPVEDLEGYNRAMLDRVDRLVEERLAQAQGATEFDNQVSASAQDLWSDFIGLHPEWEKFEDELDGYAQKLVQKVQARGGDGQSYMFGNSAKFFNDLHQYASARLGHLVDGDGDDDGDGEEVDRTAGVWGGSGTPMPRTSNKPQAGDMIEDIKAIQKKSGFW